MISHKHQTVDKREKKEKNAVIETDAWAAHVCTSLYPLQRTRYHTYRTSDEICSDSDEYIN